MDKVTARPTSAGSIVSRQGWPGTGHTRARLGRDFPAQLPARYLVEMLRNG